MRRTIFLAILAFCFFTTAFAQTNENKVLVEGNPPLTSETVDKSADFFQWALSANFTAEDLHDYQQYLVRIWTENDANSIKVIGNIVAMRDKMVRIEPEKLKTLLPQVQNGLLKELRAQPNDGLSIVLLKMYDRSSRNLDVKQGGNLPSQPQQEQKGESSDGATADAGALIGEWEESYAGNSDHGTGIGETTVRSSNHAKNIVRFYSDGSYKSAFINQSRISNFGNCKFTVSYIGTGVFSLDANTLHLNEKTRTETSRSCMPLDNYDKELQPGNYHYPWRLGRDENGLKLVLVVSGKPHVFYKVEGESVFGNE